MKNKRISMLRHNKWCIGVLLAFLMTAAFLVWEAKEQPLPEKVEQQQYNGSLQYVSMNPDGLYTTDFTCVTDAFSGLEIFLKQGNSEKHGVLNVTLYGNGGVLQTWKIKWEDAGGAEPLWLQLDNTVTDGKGRDFMLQMEVTEADSFSVGMTATKTGLALSYRLFSVPDGRQKTIRTMLLWTTVLLIIFSGCLWLWKKRNSLCPEKMFALLYTMLFLLSFLTIPIFNTPDEYSHFFRAYEISQGHMISDSREVVEDGKEKTLVGREFPDGLNAISESNTRVTKYQVEEHAEDTLNPEQSHFYSFSNTALYAPLSYLPQALGIRLASFVTDRPIAMAYAGRICNSILIGLVLFLAIRWIPFGKTGMAAAALMPMALQSFYSLSADGLALAAVFAMVSFVLHLRYQQEKPMSVRQKVLLYVITAFLCCCKIVYVPFCLLLFLIPPERFGKTTKEYLCYVFSAGAMILLLVFGWLAIASGLLVEVRPGVDTAEQIAGVLRHPLTFGKTFLRTLQVFSSDYLFTMLGRDMGWLNLQIPVFILLPYLGILAYSFLRAEERQSFQMDGMTKAMLGGCSLFVFFLIFVTLYGQWTAVGYQYIEGVQGRYFLPLLVPGLLAVSSPKSKTENEKEKRLFHWKTWLMILCIDVCVFGTLYYYASIQIG